jgi:hypothetical protein
MLAHLKTYGSTRGKEILDTDDVGSSPENKNNRVGRRNCDQSYCQIELTRSNPGSFVFN